MTRFLFGENCPHTRAYPCVTEVVPGVWRLENGWFKNITSQLTGFSGSGPRLRLWLGTVLLGAFLAAGVPALGPQQALAQNNEINGTTNADQCGHVYNCPKVSGDVSGGTLTILNSGEMIGGAQAYGGYTLEGRAYDNNFIMNGGLLRGGHGYGGYTGNGTAEGNTVMISDTGGDNDGGRVETTTIGSPPQLSGGNLYGGYSASGGNALNNVVTINNGNIYGSVIGGWVLSGQADGNEVIVSAKGLVQTVVYGGWVEGTGQAANNKVNVSGLAYIGVYGAYVNTGDALENQVTISGGQVTNGRVYGGRVENQGNAISNRVIIQAGSVIGRQIYGGYVGGGQASENWVTFEGGWVSGEIYGGYSGSGDARSNQVAINGGSVSNRVYGGRVTDGSAESNRVEISGGSVTNEIYGGWAQNGSASHNTVVIDPAASVSSAVTGGYAFGSTASSRADGNTVTIEQSGTLTGDIIGGWVQSISPGGNSASDNVVTATGGLVSGNIYGGRLVGGEGTTHQNQVSLRDIIVQSSVYGGWVDQGSAERNQVSITGSSTIDGDIYGGWAQDGSASYNTVVIDPAASVSSAVTGGYAFGSTASSRADGNTVTIEHSGALTGDIIGGWVQSISPGGNSASDNVVTATGGLVSGNIYGGRLVGGEGTTHQNQVSLRDITVQSSVYGGWVDQGSAERNQVSITGSSTIDWDIYGGWAQNGSASSNEVTLSGSLVQGNIYGGGTDNPDGWADNNIVTILDGTVEGYVSGGRAKGAATDNQVAIHGGSLESDVYGGYSEQGAATGNQVEVRGGSVDREVYGGYSEQGAATGNQVAIHGGSVAGSVHGGSSDLDAATGNRVDISNGSVVGSVYGGLGMGEANGNRVEISGGSVAGSVYGGYSTLAGATGNTVVLGAGGISGSVLGGWSLDSSMDVRTGNRLSVNGFQGSLVRLDNFEFYDFYIPSSLQNNDTLITITGNAATDLTGSKVDSLTIDQASTLTAGQQVTLIDQVSGNFDTVDFSTSKGALVLSQVSVLKESDQLIARMGDSWANPQTKALAQGALAGVVLLSQGADLASSQGLDNALNGIMTTESGRPAFFTASSAASSRVETGSHLNLDGWSLLTGLAWKADHADRNGWLAGAYFETGQGSYDGYNSFAGYNRVHSLGDTTYYGGGLMARYQWAGGFRAEASLRAGRVETDYQGSGYLGGTRAVFDLGTAYYGAHLGLGHEIPLSERLTLDLVARYIWTHENGQKAWVLGEHLEFDDVNSHRVRAGGQLTFQAHPVVTFYAGAWVEKEFDGRAGSRNLTAQISHDALKTGGTTGGYELGLRINPGRSDHFNLDLGLQGYTGRREGIGGHMSLVFTF